MIRRLITIALAATLLGVLPAGDAAADMQIKRFDVSTTARPIDWNARAGRLGSTPQAGGYAPLTADTSDDFIADQPGEGLNQPLPNLGSLATAGRHSNLNLFMAFSIAEPVKEVKVTLPPGMIGNPQAVPRCSQAAYNQASNSNQFPCPANTKVGYGIARATVSGVPDSVPIDIYNLAPGPNDVALLGAVTHANFATGLGGGLGQVLTRTTFSVRAGDHALDSTLHDLTGPLPTNTGATNTVDAAVSQLRLTIFGYPSDPTGSLTSNTTSSGGARDASKYFMTNPTSCAASKVGLEASGWNNPPGIDTASVAYTPTGCATEPFTPTVDLSQNPFDGNDDAGKPSGYDIGIHIPGDTDPIAQRQSHVNRVRFALPEGLTLNAAAANQLDGCSPAQFGLDDLRPVSCPADSQIGSVTVNTPVLGAPLGGKVFLETPLSGAATSEHPWHLLVLLEGQGVTTKLRGDVTIDQQTGQITNDFRDLPPLPFTDFKVHLRGGDNAILRNPESCGTHSSTATLTPWRSAPGFAQSADVDQTMQIDVNDGCMAPVDQRPFSPSVALSVDDTTANAHSPLHIVIDRPDGDQPLGKVNVSLPAGLVGSLRAASKCSTADAAAANCPVSSEIGEVDSSVGTSDTSQHVFSGHMYLTEPIEAGDPVSLTVVVPNRAGPIDLGNTIERVRVILRSSDQGLDNVTLDPLPSMVGGIPIDVRRLAITIDRKDFMRNPSGCDARPFSWKVTSLPGVEQPGSGSFQATGCEGLPYAPKLKMSIGGPGATARFAHTPLDVTVTQDPSESANLSSIVTLPQVLRPDTVRLNVPGVLCPAAQLATRSCSDASRVGNASVDTPLVPDPLNGPVYIFQDPSSVLPKLAIFLRGSGIAVDLFASNKIQGVRTVNTFSSLPDVPISSFHLHLDGGPNGILKNFEDLCTMKSPPTADAAFTAQSGRTFSDHPVAEVKGCESSFGTISILSRKAKVSKSGATKIKLRCSPGPGCNGKLSLRRAAGASAKRKRLPSTLGKANFSLRSGATRTVKLRLSRKARAAISRRSVKVTAVAQLGQRKVTRKIALSRAR